MQPNEGIVLKIGMKVPGAGFEVRQVTMDFSYAQLGGVPSGDAYARLIDDCIQGDPTLSTIPSFGCKRRINLLARGQLPIPRRA